MKGFAMMEARAMAVDRGKMRWGSVAFVLRKAVFRKLRIELNHHAVAGDFGHDAGGGDREALCVAFDDALRFAAQPANRTAINQSQIGNRVDLRDGFGHGFPGGLQNVDFINNVGPDDGKPDTGEATALKLFKKMFAHLLREDFRVGESGEDSRAAVFKRFALESDGGGHDWAGERTSASLVDPSNKKEA